MRQLAAVLTARPLEPHPSQVDRAIRLSYAQAMLGAVFAASTGGMFLIGFAIQLGADNVWLGLLACIPQILVVAQFPASALIERGFSRKAIAVFFAYLVPICWMLVALIPIFAPRLTVAGRMSLLISIMALAALAGQFNSNARLSWIGELIPQERQGQYFGTVAMFAAIVASVFAIIEGRFLDIIRSHGLSAFLLLFFFGAAFALAAAALNHPQPDCPLPEQDIPLSYRAMLQEALRNNPLFRLAIAHSVIAMGGIAGPFITAYCLRDVGTSFLGFGLINSVSMLAGLIASRYCGKLVDRVGCRPVVIVALLILLPLPIVWLFIPPGAVHRAYWLLPPTNMIAGIASAAISVGITTMVYKLATPIGRSVQFASYWSFVILCGAPMPFLGGLLIHGLQHIEPKTDLRVLFYIPIAFWAAAIVLFLRQSEDGAHSLRDAFRHAMGRPLAVE